MLHVSENVTWADAAYLLAVLVGIGFAVSWIATDVFRVKRGPYIALLTAATGLSTIAVVALADVSLAGLAFHHWRAGLLAGAVTGAIVGVAIRKMPADLPRTGRELHVAEGWEGLVYGLDEGLLLSGLPAFVAWQAATDASWSIPASWLAALAASGALIVTHHLGYWDYRNRQVLIVLFGCLVLTAGYLASGSLVAPVIGHVLMHVSGITKGVELPPHQHPVGAARI